MKNLFYSVILLLLFATSGHGAILAGYDNRSVAGHTDYTQDANCVGAWYMNSTSTPEVDRSGSSADMAYSRNPASSSTVPSGYSGKSLDFEADDWDGIYDVDGGSTDLNGADQAISIVFWVSFESNTGGDQSLVCKYRQYQVLHSPWDQAIAFQLVNGDESWCVGATCLYNDSTWHHVACVYNDTDQRIYIDGVLDSNGANNPKSYTGGIADGSNDLYVGKLTEWGNYSDCKIDEVGLFSRALSADEVQEIMTYGLDGTKGAND